MIAVGAAGIVSVAGNVAPELMRQLTDHARAGRMAEAEKVHRRLLPLFKALFVESNPGPVKFLLSAMGLGANQLRLPLVPVEPATEKIVLEAAKAVGLALAAPATVRA
jgi:4-hydroxy-tetrahydrodipicolinate synthase